MQAVMQSLLGSITPPGRMSILPKVGAAVGAVGGKVGAAVGDKVGAVGAEVGWRVGDEVGHAAMHGLSYQPAFACGV